VANNAATALRLAASTLSKSAGPLGRYYRRMRRHLDTAEVITAVAHKLARITYSMLRNGTEYSAELHEIDPAKAKKKALARMIKQAEKLGFTLINNETGEVGMPALASA
jgi:predicted transcriptional regulator